MIVIVGSTDGGCDHPVSPIDPGLGCILIDRSTSYRLFIRVKLVQVERSLHSQKQTLVNSVAIENFVKSVKYLEFLANVYSSIAGNVVRKCLRQSYVISLLCAA